MARTRAEKLWIGGGSAGAFIVAVAGWFLIVHPELSNTSSLHGQTDETRTQNVALQGNITRLEQESAKLPELKASLAKAQAALPGDNGLATFTRQLQAAVARTHVTVSSITAGTPSPVNAGSSSAPTATSATEASTTATASTGTSTPSSPASASAPAATPVGIYSIPVTIAISGAPANELAFVKAVQNGARVALVTSTQMTARSIGGTAAGLTVQVLVFTSPGA
ncbi:MAG TPA: hypothetical protein VE442_25530 [Jatrophihabitans sp.]|jgi:type II secretory pathway component PulM|nr:hypothetical protein [Jatrophihabitans sp.]